jgi:hypothetical protein
MTEGRKGAENRSSCRASRPRPLLGKQAVYLSPARYCVTLYTFSITRVRCEGGKCRIVRVKSRPPVSGALPPP